MTRVINPDSAGRSLRDRRRVAMGPIRRKERTPEVADCCDCWPRPWAWYRGDDLTGYAASDPVTGWPDRSGGGRDLIELGPGSNPIFVPNVLDGHPGIRGVASGRGLQWTATSPWEMHTAGHGVTVLQIQRDIDEYSAQVILGFLTTSGFELYTSDAYQECNFSGITGIGGDDTSIGHGWHAAMGQMGPNVAAMWFEGRPFNPTIDGSEYRTQATTAQWEAAPDEMEYVLVKARAANVWFAEVVVWDRMLHRDERACVWKYVNGRYPSLGVTLDDAEGTLNAD